MHFYLYEYEMWYVRLNIFVLPKKVAPLNAKEPNENNANFEEFVALERNPLTPPIRLADIGWI